MSTECTETSALSRAVVEEEKCAIDGLHLFKFPIWQWLMRWYVSESADQLRALLQPF